MYFYRLQIYCSYEACSSLFEFCVKACILERLVGVKGATTFTNHRQNFLRQNPIIENLSYKTTSYISHKWRYLRTSCWRIRNRTSERSERVRFLIQKQRVRKYRTKHFPCGIVFIIYILRYSSFWRPFYFKSFKNAKILHLPQNDNENEVSAF